MKTPKLIGLFSVLGLLFCADADAAVLVTEFNAGSVVDIEAGGDVSAEPRFATGLTGPLVFVAVRMTTSTSRSSTRAR